MGAAGRDFHNFNVYFRDNEEYEVVAFTATQVPNIEGRVYPKELTGRFYPNGIPIYPEDQLPHLIEDNGVDVVVFAYSDVPYSYVMHKSAQVLSCGADYLLLGPNSTMIKSERPVISICAVRTGSGKSQTTRRVCKILKDKGKKTVVIRHPMPYGDLKEQIVQRFETVEDLDQHKVTIEEREEYEPHIRNQTVVYAGCDYGRILKEAEKEADIIVWDGGNNDFSFYRPDLNIVVVDPHRPGDELAYHPGETNLRMADVVIINKVDTAKAEDVEMVKGNIKAINKGARVIEAASPIFVDENMIRGKKVVVVEDGPTLTHGGMKYGAGIVAAKRFGAEEIVNPEVYAVGTIKETLVKYRDLENLIPAMGYGEQHIKDLEATINGTPCDVVLVATPIDLGKVLKLNKPTVRLHYELKEIGKPDLEDVLGDFLIS